MLFFPTKVSEANSCLETFVECLWNVSEMHSAESSRSSGRDATLQIFRSGQKNAIGVQFGRSWVVTTMMVVCVER